MDILKNTLSSNDMEMNTKIFLLKNLNNQQYWLTKENVELFYQIFNSYFSIMYTDKVNSCEAYKNWKFLMHVFGWNDLLKISST